MLEISSLLNRHFINALKKAFPETTSSIEASGKFIDPQIVPASKPEFGDFQSNCALGLTKLIKVSPREIATNILKELEKDSEFLKICDAPVIAGPGFINLNIKTDRLIVEIHKRLKDKRLGIPLITNAEDDKSNPPIVIDFSSPNIAKEMHVGHLRSTIIGDSLARILEFRGYKVLRLNHIGDWGTQFGMLITHLKKVAPEALTTADAVDLGDLVSFYRQAKTEFDSDKQFQKSSREEVVKLQKGDPLSHKAWQLLCNQSRKEFQKIYDRLAIKITERGESFYLSLIHI